MAKKKNADQTSVKAEPLVNDGSSEQKEQIEARLEELQSELETFQEREKRALADYQNLVRRHREERLKLAKFANQELLTTLLQPLEHLSLAAEKLNDQGLNMVVQDLWQALKAEGLEEIKPVGQEFDEETMEAVHVDPRQQAAEKTQPEQPLTVKEVVRPGYKFHDRVLKHAQVALSAVDSN